MRHYIRLFDFQSFVGDSSKLLMGDRILAGGSG